jgi:hypothetical protein
MSFQIGDKVDVLDSYDKKMFTGIIVGTATIFEGSSMFFSYMVEFCPPIFHEKIGIEISMLAIDPGRLMYRII